MFRLCHLCLLLALTVGCVFNRSFAPISPSQIIGSSEQSRKGITALQQGNFTDAEKLLEDAVRRNKNDINYRRHYAEALWQQGKHQEALQQLDEALKRGGQNDASLHISLAEKHLALREYTKAYRYADEAVRLNAKDAQCWTLRGRAKRSQAIHEAGYAEHTAAMLNQAREDYIRAVSLASDNGELLAELATVQLDCGQPEQALATWLSVQSLYPQGGEPSEVLIGKTETLVALQRFDEVATNLMALRQRRLEGAEMEQRLQRIMTAAQGNMRR